MRRCFRFLSINHNKNRFSAETHSPINVIKKGHRLEGPQLIEQEKAEMMQRQFAPRPNVVKQFTAVMERQRLISEEMATREAELDQIEAQEQQHLLDGSTKASDGILMERPTHRRAMLHLKTHATGAAPAGWADVQGGVSRPTYDSSSVINPFEEHEYSPRPIPREAYLDARPARLNAHKPSEWYPFGGEGQINELTKMAMFIIMCATTYVLCRAEAEQVRPTGPEFEDQWNPHRPRQPGEAFFMNEEAPAPRSRRRRDIFRVDAVDPRQQVIVSPDLFQYQVKVATSV